MNFKGLFNPSICVEPDQHDTSRLEIGIFSDFAEIQSEKVTVHKSRNLNTLYKIIIFCEIKIRKKKIAAERLCHMRSTTFIILIPFFSKAA